MNFIAGNFGSYPRIGEAAGRQALRRENELAPADLDRARQEVIRDLLAEQAKAGLDAVSDGQVRWADPVSHPMAKLANVTPGPRLRYLDTPLYIRQPVVSGPVALRDISLVADEVKWSVAVSPRPVAVSVLGPLTLSRFAILRGSAYATVDALMDALVPLLADEVERLATAGAYAIVIEEPALLREPDAFPRLNDALEVIAARRGASKLWVFPSFGDCGALYDRLQALPVDGLVLDLTCGPAAGEALASAGSRLAVLLGIVDVRSTKLEMPGRLAKTVTALLRNVRAPMAGLVPSGGLEGLPRSCAFAKCRVLARARDLLKGGTGRRTGRRRGKRR